MLPRMAQEKFVWPAVPAPCLTFTKPFALALAQSPHL